MKERCLHGNYRARALIESN